MKDTFISGLMEISKNFDLQLNPSYFFGITGQGARFSLAMNVKSGKSIGHPSSVYCWDIISVTQNCLKNAGINVELFIGENYVNRARKTAAQTDRKISKNIHLISLGKLKKIEGNLLVANPIGKWEIISNTSEISFDVSEMPFGVVILKINKIEQVVSFPSATMKYLAHTLERGEEPMEIEGKGNLSTVSGWKAFARWMQSFSVPLHNIQHPFIKNFPEILLERRLNLVKYWNNLQQSLEGDELIFANELSERYQLVVQSLKELIDGGPSFHHVKNVYFTEQKTQSIYKKIGKYLSLSN